MAKTAKKTVAWKGPKPAPKKPPSPRAPRATKAAVAVIEEGNPLLGLLTALGSGEIAEVIAATEALAKRLADRDMAPPVIRAADQDLALSATEALARRLTEPRPFGAKRAPAQGGFARSGIITACSRPEGATSRELFDATGWQFASWSHQIKLAAAKTGWTPEIRKVDGTTRYFLIEPAV
jgi:hypothetical protein